MTGSSIGIADAANLFGYLYERRHAVKKLGFPFLEKDNK